MKKLICSSSEPQNDDLPEENWNNDEPYDEDGFFEPCDDCDLPDACADFGCAIKAGIKKPILP